MTQRLVKDFSQSVETIHISATKGGNAMIITSSDEDGTPGTIRQLSIVV